MPVTEGFVCWTQPIGTVGPCQYITNRLGCIDIAARAGSITKPADADIAQGNPLGTYAGINAYIFTVCPQVPAIPTTTFLMVYPDFVSASDTACLMDCMVCVILFTTPLATPRLLDFPTPRISNFPYSFFLPIIATIFVVPISNPTTILLISIFFLANYLTIKL